MGIAEELLWFIRGETNSKTLADRGVHIWDGNTTREFLDARGLDYPEGEIGPGYGFQWRNWGGDYKKWLETGERTGIDQLANLIEGIKTNPNSRRHILSSWNVEQLDQMALPPCHMTAQFIVHGDHLSCTMYQRSCDYFLGVPFNIASYSLLTHLIAHYTGLKPGRFHWFGGDVHLYKNHTNQAFEQINRTPSAFPTLELYNMPDKIDDVTLDNLIVRNYKPQPGIKAPMAV